MLTCSDSRDRALHQGSTAGFGLITRIVMIVQRPLSSCLFRLRGICKDLPQVCCLKRPLLSVKVVKVRINAAAEEF